MIGGSKMNTQQVNHTKLLKRILTANAVFSLVSALLFLAASAPLAAIVGTSPQELVQTGVSLIVFVGILSFAATRRDLHKTRWVGLAIFIAALDILWVVLTPVKMTSYSFSGKAIFGAITVAVAIFAALQVYALVGILRTKRMITQ